MCTRPVRRSKQLIDGVMQRISEGRLQAARNLLIAVDKSINPRIGSQRIDGFSINHYFNEAAEALRKAESANPSKSQETELDLALNRMFN